MILKQFLTIFICLALLLSLSPALATAQSDNLYNGYTQPTDYVKAPGDEVTIPDSNLEQAIRDNLGKPTGPITEGDLAGITILDANTLGIIDLTGLEYCTNATKLYIEENQISNLSPLSGLTHLTHISVHNNQISDLSPLAGLTNLTYLVMQKNQISDLSPLAGLINLTRLTVWDNQVSDLGPIAGLTNLTNLNLGANQLTDISLLSGLTNMTSLHLYDNQITDISALSALTNLTFISLNDCQVIDLSPLATLTSLDQLTIRGNQISDLSSLAALTNLTILRLDFNQISDISPLAGLTNLDQLFLANNQINDLSPLSGLTNLTQLYLYNNQISDLSALTGLTNLTCLHLYYNQISDISSLSGLTNLTVLQLNTNQISDLLPLQGLTNLAELYLNNNQINDLTSLAGLTNIVRLYLNDNQINDLTSLAGLTNLRDLYLDSNGILDVSPLSNMTALGDGSWQWREGVSIHLGLEDNQIADISPLVANGGLDTGDGIDLRDNPLSNDSLTTYIPQLEARDVEVLYDVKYTLSVGKSGNGTVDPSEGTHDYNEGTVVNVTATPDTGCHFVNWTGDTANIDDTNSSNTTITMNDDYSITANFAIDTHTLDPDSTAGGSVTVPGEAGPYTYDYGTVVDIVATANTGWHFINWTGDITTITNPGSSSTTITMNDDYSITANFAIDTHTLDPDSTAGGSVMVPGEAGPYTYDYGTVVNITATPDTGWHFVNWTGDITTITNPGSPSTTITMNDDYSITANFEEHVWSAWYYDTNHDLAISKQEALVAVVDFFDGYITKAQALQVIVLFFA